MSKAIEFAATIPARPWPNPPVGAVVVRDGVIVGAGAHYGVGTAHAERKALAEAGDLASGATLYCTLEPCNHYGKTEPCAPAVVESGVSRVVIAIKDPNPSVAGNGAQLIADAGVDISVGVCADEALELIWPFVVTKAFSRPFVFLKTAESSDGFLSPGRVPRDSAYMMTGKETGILTHKMRRWSDVVVVGKNCVEIDSPKLDGRNADGKCPAKDPLPAYMDTNCTLKRQWRDDKHLLFCGCTPNSLPVGAELVTCRVNNGRVAPESLIHEAFEKGIHVLMIEGGPLVAESFLNADIIDRWYRITTPIELNQGVSWSKKPVNHNLVQTDTHTVGDDNWEILDKLQFNSLSEQLSKDILCSLD